MLRSKLWQTTDAKCADLAACGTLASAVLFVLVFVAPLSAQVPRGPIKPPPSDAPQNAPPGASAAPAVISSKTIRSEISSEPPAIPKDEIIKRFAEREAEFKKERDNYTYTQTVRVQTIDDDGRPDGEYRLTSDIVFTPEGKRYEKITYAPATTLVRVNLEKRDEDDLRNVQPFVLTTAELPKYNVTYLGRQMVDELHTYVFDVAPKTIEKDQRYFQGRVWVDDKDLQIVMTEGKAVPDIVKKGSESLFPRFTTYRENIEGRFWFPTYTRADDELHFRSGPIRIRMTVRYTNYKRFGVTIKFGQAREANEDKP